MSSFRALLDANVLYPDVLRDLLLRLAIRGVYRALWSEAILAEVTRALERTGKARNLDRLQALMRRALPDAIVRDREGLTTALELPDPDDRHVLVAAIVGQAAVIVTFNGKHFPSASLAIHDIEAQHPDTFLAHAYHLDPTTFVGAVRELRDARSNPRPPTDTFLDHLRCCELANVATLLEAHRDDI